MAFSALMAARGSTMWGNSTPAALCDEIDDEWNQREFSSNSTPEGSQTLVDSEKTLQYILPAVDSPQSDFEMNELSFNSTSESNETSFDDEEDSQFILPAIDSVSHAGIFDWKSDQIKFFATPTKFANGVIFPSREGFRSADEQWQANAILDNLVGMCAADKNRAYDEFPFLYERFRRGATGCPEDRRYINSHYGAKANKAAAWILDRYEVQLLSDGDSTGDKVVDEELAEGLKEWDARKDSRKTEEEWKDIARAEEEVIRIRGPKSF